MGIVSRVKRFFSKKESVTKTPTVTQTSIPAQSQPAVRSVDIVDSKGSQAGSYTVYGGSGSRGGGGSISSTTGSVTPQQAKAIEVKTAGTGTPAVIKAKTLAPPKTTTTTSTKSSAFVGPPKPTIIQRNNKINNINPNTRSSATNPQFTNIQRPPTINSNSFFTKADDVLRAGFGVFGIRTIAQSGLNYISGGETENIEFKKIQSKADQIFIDNLKRGGPLNPINLIKTGKEYYKLRQDTRKKTDTMQNAIIQSPYKDFTLESAERSLWKAGYSPLDVEIKQTKTSTFETTPSGEVEYVTTTKTLEVPEYGTTSLKAGEVKDILQSGGSRSKAWIVAGSYGLGEVGYVGSKMLALNLVGVTGGASTEGGRIGIFRFPHEGSGKTANRFQGSSSRCN